MDINKRMLELMEQKGWSEYRLSKESGISGSTIANLFRRNSIPSIPTLEALCAGLGISLSQFFAENDLVELNPEQQEVFTKWRVLTEKQKTVVHELIESYDQSVRRAD